MNIAQLRAFVSVVERGSFSEAARELGVSQPAVSMQLQALEGDVGAMLLDRRYRRVDLTEAGRTLLPHARRVLGEIQSASEQIAEISETVTGRLVIAASTTPGVYLVPGTLGAFIADYPEVGVSVTVGDTGDVIDAVESGAAQIGIAGSVQQGRRVDFEPLIPDELVLIAAPGHRHASSKNLRLADLCEESWVLREQGSGTRRAAESIINEHGLDPAELRVVIELGTGEAIVNAVEGGLGIAMVSRLVAEKALRLGTLVTLDAEGLPAERMLYAVIPRGTMPRAARAFRAHLQEYLARVR